MKRRTFIEGVSGVVLGGIVSQLTIAGESQAGKKRIGILGTDNSHSIAFSRLINVDKRFPEYEVVAVFGQEEERTKEVAEKGKIKTIVEDPEKMLDMVDMAIVDFRHGDLHAKYALPFIEKGIPTFVDKPFALKTSDAQRMLQTAKQNGTYISSFSTVRWSDEVREFCTGFAKIGKILGGATAGPGSASSQYGGFGFYGIHAIELLTHTMADRVITASAIQEGNAVAGTVTTESGTMFSIQVAGGLSRFRAVAFGEKENLSLRTGGDYGNGLKMFFDGLKEGKPPLVFEDLFEPVAIIEAMEESMKQNGRQVSLKKLEL